MSPPVKKSLSARESEVALLASKGFSNKEIGRLLDLTEGSVKQYLYNVFIKIGVRRRAHLWDRIQAVNDKKA